MRAIKSTALTSSMNLNLFTRSLRPSQNSKCWAIHTDPCKMKRGVGSRNNPLQALLFVGCLSVVPQIYGDQLPQNPVSAYRFDEGVGTTANDAFGAATGTLQGSASFATSTPISYTGNTSLNLSATGANDYVSLGDQPSLFFPNSFSISAWVRSTSEQTNPFGTYIVADYDANGGASSFALRLNGTNANQGNTPGEVSFFWENPGGNLPQTRSTTDVDASLNTWFHIVAVWNDTDGNAGNAGIRSLYVNGVLEGTNSTPQDRSDNGAISAIGRPGSFSNAAFNFNGNIDDVAFFDYALNKQEASWLHNNSIRQVPSTTTAPKQYWVGGTGTWSASDVNQWSTASGAATPHPGATPGIGDDVFFNISTVSSNQIINTQSADRSANSLTFNFTNSGTTALVRGTAGASTLTIGGFGGRGIVVEDGAGAVTIGNATQALNVVIKNSQAWANNGSNQLTVLNGITTPATAGIYTLALTGAGTGGISLNGVIADGSATAKLGLSIYASGVIALTGLNTYTGGTVVGGGTLVVNADAALGNVAGALTLSGGATLKAGAAAIVLNRAVVLDGVGGVIDTNGNSVTLGATSSVTGTSLTKNGAGILNLNGTQSYTDLATFVGTTNINTALGSGTSTITANAATNISVSQTLTSLSIGPGAVVTLGAAAAPPAPFADELSVSPDATSIAVPEPGSVSLLILGCLGMFSSRRGRKA